MEFFDRYLKGAKTTDALLIAGQNPVSQATLACGVANWHLYNGRKDQAKALFLCRTSRRCAFK